MAQAMEGKTLAAFWRGMERGPRVVAIAAAALLLGVLGWVLVIALRPDYRVLFSDLAQRDAATIVQQLKQSKVKYRLEDGGTTITVPAERVHEMRLQLMSSDLPLSGGVGFEIFDKQGLGTTESSQRVSYQRALQGELSRTIGSLENVKQARVHLVLAESSLFRKDRQEASAAVTLAMQPGSTLDRAQILGVQRLVAAAVPGLEPDRVVVTDHRGITLSATAPSGIGAGAAEARLETKRAVEDYVTCKFVHLLDGAFGPGQAIVSVDATLNFDATKRTVQDLVPARNAQGELQGQVVRKRQVMNTAPSDPVWTTAADGGAAPAARSPTNSSMEVEYEYGKRLEEVITAPGGLVRLSIGIIVPETTDASRKHKIEEIVRAAAGVDDARGDVISVQDVRDLGAVTAPNADLQPEQADDASTGTAGRSDSAPRPRARPPAQGWNASWIAIAIAVLLAILVVVRFAIRPRELSQTDRESLLRELQAELGIKSPATGSVARS
jgi:flagellar M-ring protein FliF